MNKAYLLIGGNMGDREELIRKAELQIEATCGPILSTSSLYETAAWGLKDQASFLLLLDTKDEPLILLRKLQKIETLLGRVREQRWGPRTMDIDLIFYNELILKTPELTIPHPGIQDRRFVLEPLCEIAGEWTHPVLKKSMLTLLHECSDEGKVEKLF